MCNKEDEARSHKLMYKAFELNLSKPSHSQIASTILYDNDCDDLQSNNNLSFLQKIEKAISEYVYGIELNLNNSDELAILDCDCDCDCDCDYDCECSLSNFVMPTFRNIARNFDLDIDANNSLVNAVLELYTIEERHRLLDCNISELTRIMMYKSLAYLSYDLGFYDISCRHHEVAVLIYGGATAQTNFDPSEYIQSELSTRNKKAADTRWKAHREKKKERKKKYLKIMKEQGFSTYTDTASYIKQHIDTGKKPSFNTVCRLLSEADKGNFS